VEVDRNVRPLQWRVVNQVLMDSALDAAAGCGSVSLTGVSISILKLSPRATAGLTLSAQRFPGSAKTPPSFHDVPYR
jgi:hypothetical protein